MNMPIHELVSPHEGTLICRLPNLAAFGADETERVTDVRRRDDEDRNEAAQDRYQPKLLHELIKCLREQKGVQPLCIWLHSPRNQSARWQLLVDGLSAQVCTVTELSSDNSIIDWVWQHQRSLIIATEEETRFPDFVRLQLDSKIKYFCAIPLILANRKIGVLGLASATREALHGLDLRFVQRGVAISATVPESRRPHHPARETRKGSPRNAIWPLEEESSENDFEGVIGRSAPMRALCKKVKIVAPTGSTVLILGETGTGKELVARAIHNLSPRSGRPFVKVNCAAIPAGLIESELFGHERGAFTGAVSRRTGRFEMADGGTLLLDEIGDIPLELQPKLLRVLQEQEFERVGSTQTTRVNVRIVTATSRDLRSMVASREFRPDLYYRLNVLPLHVPALRERSEDIPLLVRHFVRLYCGKANKQITEVPVEAMEVLVRHHWPGNVRELQNVVERAVILSPGEVLRPSLDELEKSPQTNDPTGAVESDDLTTLKDAEREHIIRALAATNWVIGGPKGAAARLGLRRTTLIAKMQKLGITRMQA